MLFIDTHSHLDGQEFDNDRDAVVERAREAGVQKILIPAIDLPSVDSVLNTCHRYLDFAYPMIGLHPEEIKTDWREIIEAMKLKMTDEFIAIGEVGLDFYWSREFEKEQLEAFEAQVKWAVETGLPLMIHCRKAQQELVKIIKRYEKQLVGGVFHCFTGNEKEAAELLQFNNFVLGIGGVLTFKKSKLPDVLSNIPLSRIVLETDSPYMAPVPMRGNRNESAFLIHVIEKLAEIYQVSTEEIAGQTNDNVYRVFKKL